MSTTDVSETQETTSSSTTANLRQCSECSLFLPKSGYSLKNWKLNSACRECKYCTLNGVIPGKEVITGAVYQPAWRKIRAETSAMCTIRPPPPVVPNMVLSTLGMLCGWTEAVSFENAINLVEQSHPNRKQQKLWCKETNNCYELIRAYMLPTKTSTSVVVSKDGSDTMMALALINPGVKRDTFEYRTVLWRDADDSVWQLARNGTWEKIRDTTQWLSDLYSFLHLNTDQQAASAWTKELEKRYLNLTQGCKPASKPIPTDATIYMGLSAQVPINLDQLDQRIKKWHQDIGI